MTARRAATPLVAESIGAPAQLSSLAALLLRMHQAQQQPALRLVAVRPPPPKE
jgi:hypothetical protein